MRLGSFLNTDGIHQSSDEANCALPSWKRLGIVAMLSCIVVWVVAYAPSTEFAFELSPQTSAPFAIRIFTSGFDVFAGSHLHSAFTWGRYHLEFRFGPDPTALSPVLDYGSLSTGAMTIDELTSPTYTPPTPKRSAIWRNIFSQGSGANNPPALVLTGGIAPGQCWAFQGNSGQLGIRLSQAIQAHALTVGHASLSSATSAPKKVALWGLKPADSDFCSSLGDESTPGPNFSSRYCGVHLISGIYKPTQSNPYQNFTVRTDSLSSDYFDHMIVEVSENWGHPTYTCIYRIQIYGQSRIID